MLSTESGVLPNSDYYIHTPSVQSKNTFFYPTYTGFFHYDSDYHLERNTYDSFLLMLVKKGKCIVSVDHKTFTASENQIVFIDCFKPHSYYTKTGWEALWLHFDGIAARQYFDMITKAQGYIISLKETYTFEKSIRYIYNAFREGTLLKEALLSLHITNALTELLVSSVDNPSAPNKTAVDDTILYIKEHLCETLTLESLSSRVSLSPFYFTRLFKMETGFTPHEYIIATRINTAKYLLRNSQSSIKEICFSIGFASESNFCSTFKKWEQQTPSKYRDNEET